MLEGCSGMASVVPASTSAVQGTDGLELLVAEIDKLVSLPDIYYRLEETIVDPTSTMEVIANLLRSDPDLCARMLRMANSAFYSFPTRIETIERAVGTIGLRQIRELVLVTAVVKAFEGIPPGTVNMETFWEHSIAVGIMARELGQQARLANADGFYIPGLLHDIGRLVMYLKLPGLMCELLERHETVPVCSSCGIYRSRSGNRWVSTMNRGRVTNINWRPARFTLQTPGLTRIVSAEAGMALNY
jgi:HD-like signal output (HDOD) protein